MELRNPDNKKYVKAGVTAVISALVIFIVALAFVRYKALNATFRFIISILKPFLYGAVLAYLLAPLCNDLDKVIGGIFRHKFPKLTGVLSILISMLVAVSVIVILFILLIPQVVTSVMNLIDIVPGHMSNLNILLTGLLQDQPELLEQWEDFYFNFETKLNSWLMGTVLPQAETILAQVGSHVSTVLTFLKNIFLGFIICIYMLGRRKQFAAQGKLTLHGIFGGKWAEVIEREIRFADKMFNGFFVGKLIDSAIIGVICFIGCLILRLPSPLLLSVIVGVTNIIPFFGPFLGAVPCILLLVIENPWHALIFLGFIIVLQQLDGNVIGPLILGDTTGLSGFWVMFAILFFGGMWGITGMVVGVPLFAVIYDIIRSLLYRGVRTHGLERMIDEYNAEYHPPVEPKGKKKRGKREAVKDDSKNESGN